MSVDNNIIHETKYYFVFYEILLMNKVQNNTIRDDYAHDL